MKRKKYQGIISMLSSIVITASLLMGCSSSQPESENKVVTTEQQL